MFGDVNEQYLGMYIQNVGTPNTHILAFGTGCTTLNPCARGTAPFYTYIESPEYRGGNDVEKAIS